MLHFAGGNCYSFQFLRKHLQGFNLIMLELPGRGRRVHEPLVKTMEAAADDLLEQFLRHQIDGKFMLFGHSMGATMSLLLTKRLERHNLQPAQLVVTGSCGPRTGNEKTNYLLPPLEFKEMLRNLGGISSEVLDEEELFEYFEAIIRADFELLEKEEIGLSEAVSVPIHAIMAEDEEDKEHIENWKQLTTGKVELELWPGRHFFILDAPERLANTLKSYCSGLTLNR
jgi:external thioesterase TEII